MKKIFLIAQPCFLFIICLCFSCRKNNAPIDKSNIVLYNKPLSIIQECIHGRWELVYGKGGISANTVQYYHDDFWELNNNRIKILDSGNVFADTTIQWINDSGTFTNGAYTYTINFYDLNYYPHKYIVDGIYNDTLILGDYAYDGMAYYFVKSN